MDIKTTSDAFTISMVLVATETNEAKIKECQELADFFASLMPKREVDLCLRAVDCTLEYAKTYKLNNLGG